MDYFWTRYEFWLSDGIQSEVLSGCGTHDSVQKIKSAL